VVDGMTYSDFFTCFKLLAVRNNVPAIDFRKLEDEGEEDALGKIVVVAVVEGMLFGCAVGVEGVSKWMERRDMR